MQADEAYLNLEGEVLLHVLDDHHQEGQLDAQRLLRICRTCYERGADIGADYFQHEALYVVVGDPLDVSIAHLLIPQLQWLRANTVQNR